MENMEQKQAKLVYETPSVEVLHWECDIIMTSTDVGGEYDGDNWY